MPADEPNVRKRAERLIRNILTAPGVDYQTVTAKRVRKSLVEAKGLQEVWVRENKEVLDLIILEVYNEVSTISTDTDDEPQREDTESDQEGSGGGGAEVPKTPTAKRKRGDVLKEEERARASGALTSPNVKIADKVKQQRKKEKGKGEAVEDARIAWQLQQDLNLGTGRTTRGSGSGRKGAGAAAPGKGAKRGGKVKSKEVIEDSSEEGGSGDGGTDSRPKKKRKTTGANGEAVEGKQKGGGWSKPQPLSELLAAIVGASTMSRPQVVKKMWEYIHAKGLQNPDNKKEIICDEKFRAMFNVNKIDMFRMNKELSKHIGKS